MTAGTVTALFGPRGMSVAAGGWDKWAWSQALRAAKDLTMAECSVARALLDRANDAGCCFPSVKTIAEDANCTERTVQHALHGDRRVRLGQICPSRTRRSP